MVDPIDRNELLEYVWRCRLDSRERIDELVRSMPTLPYAQSEPLKIIIDHEPMADELERIKQAMRNTPVMLLPSAQPSFSQHHENDQIAEVSKKVVPCEDAAKRLNDLIFDINPAEICSQIESDNLTQWCRTIQTEMKLAMVQLPCWGEGDE